jgi:hypothetical protein
MTDTLAYEIGAAFFLAVLLMGGSMTRGLMPAGLFKNIKLAVIVIVVGLAGMMAYQNLPSAWGRFVSEGSSAEKSVVQEQPAAKPTTPKHSAAAGKIREVETVITAKPEEPAAEQTDGPVIVRPAEDSEKESRSKRVVKSVGRFLHLGHKKDDGDQ